MVSQCVVLLHGRQSNGADLVVLGDLSLAWTGVEGQIDATTEGPPGQVLRLRDNLEAMGVSQKDTVGEGLVLLLGVGFGNLDGGERTILVLFKISGIQIEGVTAVEIPVWC